MSVVRPDSLAQLTANQIVTVPPQRVDGPLVPELYRRMQLYLGEVAIANPGEEMAGAWGYDPVRQRPRFIVTHYGETYRANCPFCSDTRKRLWIPYGYAMQDPANPQYQQTFFGTCYNEACLENHDNRKQLADRLVGFINAEHRQMIIRPGVQVATTVGPRNPPGVCMPISNLVDNHPARQYLCERAFYAPTWQAFNLSVCTQVGQDYLQYSRLLLGRIVIPLIFNGMYAGWQARAVGDVPKGVPKYFTCPQMPRRLCLYNYDTARQHTPFVVVFEGPTDVWRLPWCSVALLGKAMTVRQRQLLQETWPGRPIVLVLDPDAEDEMRDQLQLLQQERTNPVCAVRLPANVDPAQIEERLLLQEIFRQAAQQGINLVA